ncbi:alpha/beta hydrolase [Nocardia sp. NBC_01503]|uniref:alpha/beta fold hydrolase n=1 Tax=Nocardia sp. NBC_01503 TaxID=2975997 RepID=UPI002E7AE061|nr:alpha/beta hydrolase [Nocardia sp. NBC_01503]WTL34785.1 alpha/beta hydrolase [Nocardia sp. NBC_01503]
MENFAYDGTRLSYLQRGDSGPPVVMLHNAGSSHVIWTPQITALARKYRVYALDLPGYGSADQPESGYTLDRYAELVRQFLLDRQLSRVAMVGNCLGSAISLTLARRYPELFRAVVAINPLTESTAMHGDLRVPARITRGLPDPAARALFDWHTPKWFARGTIRSWFSSGRAYRECPYVQPLSAGFPARALVGLVRDLSCFAALDDWPDREQLPPVCTIWGTENRVLSAAAGRTLNAQLRPERAEWLDRCGHVPMLERAPEVTAIITEFLATTDATDSHRHSEIPAESTPG